ncbi:MAG: aminopeptidase P family protein [Clostridiales bacterium]|nr:aminopeptidase P family protein [Clostridiales bacterium]
MSITNRRIEALQAKLNARELDGVLYTLGAASIYLLEADGYNWQRQSWANIARHFGDRPLYGLPEILLYVPCEGGAHLFCTPRKGAGLREVGLAPQEVVFDRFYSALFRVIKGRRIAVGDVCEDFLRRLLDEVAPDFELFEGESLCAELRRVKEPGEIARLEAAARLTDDAMGAILGMIGPGVTAQEVEDFFTDYGLSHGATDLSFGPTCCVVKTGNLPEANEIGGRPKQKPIELGCGLAFDLGYVLGGYCSDFGRSFYCGEPTRHMADAYAALQAGQVNMIEHIRPYETNVNELYGYVHEAVAAHGYGDVLRFPDTGSLGHQIGIDCHEHPMLNKGVDFVLEPGMVFASEPKIWLPGEMYMRVEDMVLVTEIGARALTVFDRVKFAL